MTSEGTPQKNPPKYKRSIAREQCPKSETDRPVFICHGVEPALQLWTARVCAASFNSRQPIKPALSNATWALLVCTTCCSGWPKHNTRASPSVHSSLAGNYWAWPCASGIRSGAHRWCQRARGAIHHSCFCVSSIHMFRSPSKRTMQTQLLRILQTSLVLFISVHNTVIADSSLGNCRDPCVCLRAVACVACLVYPCP